MGTHPIFESDFDCLTGFQCKYVETVYSTTQEVFGHCRQGRSCAKKAGQRYQDFQNLPMEPRRGWSTPNGKLPSRPQHLWPHGFGCSHQNQERNWPYLNFPTILPRGNLWLL